MIKTLPLSSRAKTTSLKQPKELFIYARDGEGRYVYEKEKVRSQHTPYFYFPDSEVDKGVDLGAGYSSAKFIPEEENLGDFDAVLKGIMRYEQESGSKVNADVVTFRGIMTKILTLPYNLTDPINLQIVSYDGQLFIKNNDEVELKRRQQEEMQFGDNPAKQDYMKRCQYTGYKFETLATLDTPWGNASRQAIDGRRKKVVSNYEQYLSVVRTGIGKVKILVAGEVDGVWDYVPTDSDVLPHYLELKVAHTVENPGQAKNFEKKLFRTWAQCFLIGVRRVVYGFRDDNLILRDVEVFSTDEIPLMLKNSPVSQQKIACMNALKWYGAVIEWLTANIPRDQFKLWTLQYDPGSKSFFVSEDIVNDKQKESIVSAEFRAWREALNARAASESEVDAGPNSEGNADQTTGV
ncbi:Piso0_004104 [Millerozyma farinosa CBS 7064]|uniref:Decapping nuclease n=1 Tax=Pichia sorbitophila (strain ATCC MYA-4447 / BCRC 22081 / CBS 7064 / NBRC 10061 / NRRL Y-12695) TaxID=559304 RepID=G8Y7H7_PICSO|nr:Piso0_004104 [Millerozyma farinosa CBS 7064]CCE84557.1 Piso0_004104 [Millerozyma farinosa CBS 7064]